MWRNTNWVKWGTPIHFALVHVTAGREFKALNVRQHRDALHCACPQSGANRRANGNYSDPNTSTPGISLQCRYAAPEARVVLPFHPEALCTLCIMSCSGGSCLGVERTCPFV